MAWILKSLGFQLGNNNFYSTHEHTIYSEGKKLLQNKRLLKYGILAKLPWLRVVVKNDDAWMDFMISILSLFISFTALFLVVRKKNNSRW